MTKNDPHRQALLSKAAALVAPLIASVMAAQRREAQAATLKGQLYLMVSEALQEGAAR